jgi:hypothetical protein
VAQDVCNVCAVPVNQVAGDLAVDSLELLVPNR